MPIDLAIDLLFLPQTGSTSTSRRPTNDEEEVEVAEEDLGVSFYANEEIDLGEMIREQLYLAVPMKPLCRADCAGLCPISGINRNRERCTCEATWVDPRLEPLRKLRQS